MKYPLSFALVAAVLVVLCFSLIPSWDPHLGFVDYGTFRQTITAAFIVAVLYLLSGEYLLGESAGEKAAQQPEALREEITENAPPGQEAHENQEGGATFQSPPQKFPLMRTLAMLTIAAAALGAAKVLVQGSTITPPRSAIIIFIVMLLGTAVFEEILFRGLFFEAFAKILHARRVKNALLYGALASSFLFGALHVSSDLGSLFRATAYIQAGVKITEALLFGLVMCALYISRHSVWPAVLIHFVFNLISEGPIYLATGVQTSSYITGSPADIAVLALGTAILLPAAKWAWDYLSLP